MGLFEHIEELLTRPFVGEDDQFNALEWGALTVVTVVVAFFTWHLLRHNFAD